MKHLHIALIDPSKTYAKAIAKKSGESDYTMYNHKEGEVVICLYEPHMFPTKIQSMLGALNSSDFIVWVIDGINPDFAETAVAVWLTGKKGILIFKNIGPEELKPILATSPMWAWERLEEPDPNLLRQKLMALEIPIATEPAIALVDSSFAVGGVGTVALTKVESGHFKVHDELEVSPAKMVSAIRSIQEQDVDAKETSPASRAGFALKNITPEQIRRGSYLAPKGVMTSATSGKAKIQISPLLKEPLEPGAEVFFAIGLQYISGKLEHTEPLSAKSGVKEVAFQLTAPAAFRSGWDFLLVRANKRPRIIGSGKIL